MEAQIYELDYCGNRRYLVLTFRLDGHVTAHRGTEQQQ